MSNKEAVKKLLQLLGKYHKEIIEIICCLFISTGLSLCVPLVSRRIMDEGFIGGNKKILVEMVFVSLAIYIINSLIDVVKEKKRVGILSGIQYFLSKQSFSHLLKLQIQFFDNKNNAEILNNITVDINRMASVADSNVFFVITQLFSMTGGVIGLFLIDYRMTLLVLLFIPVKYLVMKYFTKRHKQLVDEYIKTNQQYAKWFGDTIGGVREVKLFSIYANKEKEFSDRQSKVIEKQKQINMHSSWNTICDTVMVELLSTGLYLFGANAVFDLRLSVGSVFAFITYSAYVTSPISVILNIGYMLSGIIPSTKRYYAFMELGEETNNNKSIGLRLDDLRMEQVSYTYENGKKALRNIDILFTKGSKTAVVGHNGSGKTTMMNLLTRMYKPTNGKILLGKENILELPLQEYRDLVSVVSQQIYLFNDTVRNNICLYRQVEEAEMISICLDCGLGKFIEEKTLDYIVGHDGAMLSGGQKQKIALARALIHDKPFVIFDEATSHADKYSEKQINELLHTRLRDKTVIVITHRDEILKEVDQIVVLEEGRIIEKKFPKGEKDTNEFQANV